MPPDASCEALRGEGLMLFQKERFLFYAVSSPITTELQERSYMARPVYAVVQTVF
jgi:aspartate oxidase